MDDPSVTAVIEELEPAGPVRARAMFGGAGLYLGGVFFAIVVDGELYFRVDDASRADFAAAGSRPFRPTEDATSPGSYWRVPDRVRADARDLRAWTLRALEAARARDRGRTSRRRAKADRTDPSTTILRMRIPDVGPAARRWLREVGVATRGDLERVGSAGAVRAIRANGRRAGTKLLYALEGALLGLRGDLLPDVVRANLRERAGL